MLAGKDVEAWSDGHPPFRHQTSANTLFPDAGTKRELTLRRKSRRPLSGTTTKPSNASHKKTREHPPASICQLNNVNTQNNLTKMIEEEHVGPLSLIFLQMVHVRNNWYSEPSFQGMLL